AAKLAGLRARPCSRAGTSIWRANREADFAWMALANREADFAWMALANREADFAWMALANREADFAWMALANREPPAKASRSVFQLRECPLGSSNCSG